MPPHAWRPRPLTFPPCAVLEHLATDGFPVVPPFLAAVSSLRSLTFLERPHFELGSAGTDVLRALPHLTSLQLPRLAEGGQRAVERLRRERPQLSICVAGEGVN